MIHIALPLLCLSDEVHCDVLPVLPAVLGSGAGLRGVCVRVEQPVEGRLCLGRLPPVQLAPGADGDGSAGSVWLR